MQANNNLLQIPVPSDVLEASRWDCTRRRRRLLDGYWQTDLLHRVKEQLGIERFKSFGSLIDLSSNPFRNVAKALSVLYDTKPEFVHKESSALDFIGENGIIKKSKYYSFMPRFQMNVLGCREYLMRVSLDRTSSLRFRAVSPDVVIADAYDDMPDIPCVIKELRKKNLDGKDVWTWEVFDIKDSNNPIYGIFLAGNDDKLGDDITSKFYQNQEDYALFKGYPWRYSNGDPFLPYILYHAQQPADRLWLASEQEELVEGTLNIGVYWSHWGHVVRDSSWPQRWVLNALPVGSGVAQDGSRSSYETDPATVVALESTSETNQAQVGQWQAGGDPLVMLQAISEYASRLAREADVPEGDIQRLGGTARSGYAISLSNEGKRQAQRKYMVQFRSSDEELLSKSAAICNRLMGTNFPESEYSVIYKEIPLSPDEMRARAENVFSLLDRGMITRERAYMEFNPGITEEQALRELQKIDASARPAANMGFYSNQPQQMIGGRYV